MPAADSLWNRRRPFLGRNGSAPSAQVEPVGAGAERADRDLLGAEVDVVDAGRKADVPGLGEQWLSFLSEAFETTSEPILRRLAL